MENQQLSIQEILSRMNRNNVNSQYMSFRLSDDYQPNFQRYSKQDELQQINLQLWNEEFDPEIDDSFQNQVKIAQQNEIDKLVEVINEEKIKKSRPPKPSKSIQLKKQDSIKISQKLKKKISLKKQTDQFTKKYDDLFDQIFFQHKEIQQKQKLEPKEKNQNSLISNNILEKKNPQIIQQKIENSIIQPIKMYQKIAFQASQLAKNVEKFANQQEISIHSQKNTIPKVVINYQSKILISIKPTQNKGNNSSMTKVKFSYGQTQNSPPKKKQYPPIPYNISQELRLPVFLVQLRNKTNTYPNFYNKKYYTIEICNQLNSQLKAMVQQCKKAIKILKQSHLTLHRCFESIRQLYQKLSDNIFKNYSMEDKLLLEYFLSKDWPSFLDLTELQVIRPRDFFINRPFNELQFITYLSSFDQIIQKIQNDGLIDFENIQTTKNYMKCRDQLWGIQKNLRIMSQDLYSYSIGQFSLPRHITASYDLAKRINLQQSVPFDGQRDQLLQKLIFLKDNKDIFGSSWLGTYLINSLQILKL